MRFLPTILILSLCSCDQNLKETQGTDERILQIKDLSPFVEKGDWKITFTSRGGNLAGMDSDSELVFGSDGRIRLIEYGYAPQYYGGIYKENSDGMILVTLADYPGDWPSMVLREKEGRFLLFRTDGKTHLEFGGRAGGFEGPGMDPFWPFGASEFTWEKAKEFDPSSEGSPLSEDFKMLPSGESTDQSEQ